MRKKKKKKKSEVACEGRNKLLVSLSLPRERERENAARALDGGLAERVRERGGRLARVVQRAGRVLADLLFLGYYRHVWCARVGETGVWALERIQGRACAGEPAVDTSTSRVGTVRTPNRSLETLP